MGKRIVIVSGGKLEEDFVLATLNEPESNCVIGVDKGIEFLYHHQIIPNYLVGDFDSIDAEVFRYYREETGVPIREYNPVKDASDTEIAIRLALTLGCKELLIFGATGGRLDHLWGNVQCLSIPLKAGVDARILDRQNEIRLIDHPIVLKKEEAYGPYFSVFSLGSEVPGLEISGAKYPLRNHLLTPYDSLCVSNQFDGDEVTISFRDGIVILMETRDKPEQ